MIDLMQRTPDEFGDRSLWPFMEAQVNSKYTDIETASLIPDYTKISGGDGISQIQNVGKGIIFMDPQHPAVRDRGITDHITIKRNLPPFNRMF